MSMGKFIIFVWLCSATTTVDCKQIKVDRVKFSDQYDCTVYGYTHSTKLIRGFGRKEINKFIYTLNFYVFQRLQGLKRRLNL